MSQVSTSADDKPTISGSLFGFLTETVETYGQLELGKAQIEAGLYQAPATENTAYVNQEARPDVGYKTTDQGGMVSKGQLMTGGIVAAIVLGVGLILRR